MRTKATSTAAHPAAGVPPRRVSFADPIGTPLTSRRFPFPLILTTLLLASLSTAMGAEEIRRHMSGSGEQLGIAVPVMHDVEAGSLLLLLLLLPRLYECSTWQPEGNVKPCSDLGAVRVVNDLVPRRGRTRTPSR